MSGINQKLVSVYFRGNKYGLRTFVKTERKPYG